MKFNQEELKNIVLGCKQNHRASQQKVYEMFYSQFLPVCNRYARNSDEAKDILQNGFIKVFEKIKKYNFEGSFGGWVRRIIVNTAIDHYRKHKNELYLIHEENLKQEEETENDESIYSSLSIKDINEAIELLSPAYKLAFTLYVLEGYSHKEIADKLNVSVGTSKSNLAKAKLKIKKMLLKKLKHEYR